MNRFDDELKIALRREEPSPDFTNRVMARIADLPVTDKLEKEGIREQEARKRRRMVATDFSVFRPPQMKWAMAGAMAALLIASVIGLNRYRQHQIEAQRQAEIAAEAEGQRAKEQVMFAMRIASAKLNLAQKKVKESIQRDGDTQEGRHQN